MPGRIARLAGPLLGGIEVVPLAGRQSPATPFDCHVHLMSLPLLAGRAPDQIPCDVPYLRVDAPAPRRAAAGLRVGVCWAGSPTHPQDLQRSMAPEFLAPLARLPGVTLVSLQKPSRDWPALPGLDRFLQAPPQPLSDFMSTARAIAGLDLVISVDTAVAHLAGALGRPVWLLLCSAGEWRWLVGRGDSPWYPTLRIFRQRRLGAWADLVGDVGSALAAFTPR